MKKDLINKKLQKLRYDFDYSEEFVAGLCNISLEELANWENGEKTPSLEGVLTLSNLYNVSFDELLNRYQTDTQFSPINIFLYVLNILGILLLLLPLFSFSTYTNDLQEMFEDFNSIHNVFYIMIIGLLFVQLMTNFMYIRGLFHKENHFRRLTIIYSVLILVMALDLVLLGYFVDGFASVWFVIYAAVITILFSFTRYESASIIFEHSKSSAGIKRVVASVFFSMHLLFALASLIIDFTVYHEYTWVVYSIVTLFGLIAIPFIPLNLFSKRVFSTCYTSLSGAALWLLIITDGSTNVTRIPELIPFTLFLFVPALVINYDLFANLWASRKDM